MGRPVLPLLPPIMEPFAYGFKQVNGIRLYYELYGSGQPLVLVHGGGASFRHDYAEVISELPPGFLLIGIDLQNHGRSGHRDIPQTFGQDARDVIALLEALDIGKASFMGFSNGGNTVLQIASLFPEKTERLVVASAFYKRSGMPDGFFEGMRRATLESMPRRMQDHFLQLKPDRAALQHMFEKDRERMASFTDWPEEMLRGIKAPTLFISGDRDVMTPEHVTEMWRLLPDARLLLLPAGHGTYLMADENGQPDHALITFTVFQIARFLKIPK